MIPRWDGDGPVPYSELPPRAALNAGQVRLARLDGLYEEAPGAVVRWIFAWRMGYTVIATGALDAGHWVHRYVKDLETASFDIESIGSVKCSSSSPTAGSGARPFSSSRPTGLRLGRRLRTPEVTDAGLYHCFDEDNAGRPEDRPDLDPAGRGEPPCGASGPGLQDE